MNAYLYRSLDADEDGDPYDFGVLTARDEDHALELLQAHFANILGFDEDLEVYLYALAPETGPGVWDSLGRILRVVPSQVPA